MLRILAAVALFSSAEAALAEVVDAAEHGFTVRHETVVAVDRAAAWRTAVADIGQWWSSDHTVGGDAGTLTIDPRPLGCFCESLPGGGSVVHLVVTFVNPGVMLRLTGGLGPLGLMGVDGNMTWEFSAVDGGTQVRWTYAVGGYAATGLDAIAGPVDSVIGDALARFAARATQAGDQ